MERTIRGYKVTVEQVIVETDTEVKQVCIKETPTEITQQRSYGSGEEKLIAKEYETREVPTRKVVSAEIYKQETGTNFDLVAVINAVNKAATT